MGEPVKQRAGQPLRTEDTVCDRIKAGHAQVMGLTYGMIDLPDTEDFQQPQDLDVFLASAFVHACFEQASQSLEGRR